MLSEPRGVRGYYHVRAQTKEELAKVRASAKQLGITAFKSGIPGHARCGAGYERYRLPRRTGARGRRTCAPCRSRTGTRSSSERTCTVKAPFDALP